VHDLLSVGEGARRAWLLRPAGEPGAAVLFLHGSGELDPAPSRPWLEHLAAGGAAVIYPQYQPHADAHGATLLDDLAAGFAAAWAVLDRPQLPLGAIGFSRGAFLAVHHAARAAADGQPVPRAILGVFPGRRAGDQAADLRRLPAEVDLTLLVGDRDDVVGRDGAELLIADLAYHPEERLRLIEVVSHGELVADHVAPLRDDEAAREAFWRRGDALVERVRRSAG
jgi:dienelactone hydrolase